MIKINGLKIKGYSFTGRVDIDDLPDDVLAALHVNRLAHNSDTIRVEGSFTAYANGDDDGEVDSIEIDLIGAYNGKTHVEYKRQFQGIENGMQCYKSVPVDVASTFTYNADKDERFDLDSLAEQLAESCDWYEIWHERAVAYADFMEE